MKNKIFTFWEGPMPAYIKLCMDTWMFPHIVLNYENLHHYTDLQISPKLRRFTMPQIADAVRVHVLRDQGGYWLDADTIMITGNVPAANMIGDPAERTQTIGFLYAQEPNTKFFTAWAGYQDLVIDSSNPSRHWSIMGNTFTDRYVKEHDEVTIAPVRKCWPETYMIEGDMPRGDKYTHLYFGSHYHLADIEPTDMLMLHNSWTPAWYKRLTEQEVIDNTCTLSNILREVLNGND